MPASPICQQSRFPSKGCTLIDLEAWGRVDQDSSHAGLEIVRKYLANDISPCFQGEMVITIHGKVSLVKIYVVCWPLKLNIALLCDLICSPKRHKEGCFSLLCFALEVILGRIRRPPVKPGYSLSPVRNIRLQLEFRRSTNRDPTQRIGIVETYKQRTTDENHQRTWSLEITAHPLCRGVNRASLRLNVNQVNCGSTQKPAPI